jgi:hypothetical protein
MLNIRAKWSGIDAASSGSVNAKDAGFEIPHMEGLYCQQSITSNPNAKPAN